jgi:hypothetical protein
MNILLRTVPNFALRKDAFLTKVNEVFWGYMTFTIRFYSYVVNGVLSKRSNSEHFIMSGPTNHHNETKWK